MRLFRINGGGISWHGRSLLMARKAQQAFEFSIGWRSVGSFSLLTLPEEKRKDADARREAIHAADISILCLPDAAARESVALAEGSKTRILDTSTAHRVAPRLGVRLPGIVQEASGRRHLRAIRRRAGLPRQRVHCARRAAGRRRADSGGYAAFLLLPDRVQRRRQEDDCPVRGGHPHA